MKRIPKWLRIAALLVLSAPIALTAAVYLAGKASVAPLSGTLSLPGLSARVEIVRDAEAVPHIFGTALDDLYTALGFVHAQDRLWQMELMRRAGQGRLSEVFGERTLGTDIFIRTPRHLRPRRRERWQLCRRASRLARSLRARRQRLPRSPDKPRRAALAARVPAAAPSAGALATRRQHRRAQDDGA